MTRNPLFALIALLGLAVALPSAAPAASPESVKSEVVVYGGTPAGVMAAVAAARQGRTVSLVELNKHVGGMTSGGLTNTDIGDRSTVGGLADEFLKRAVQYYSDKYGPSSPQYLACKNGRKYEPHVAELVFEKMLKETGKVTVFKQHRYRTVKVTDGRVVSMVVDDLAGKTTRTFTGDIFIDASYTGDLMAGANVPYRVGREGQQEYGEYLAGITVGPNAGQGDKLIQAYNYRVNITGRTENRVLFPKPEQYDPKPFLKKYGERVKKGDIKKFGDLFISKPGANEKYDANWCDLPGGSSDYPEADWETRAKIEARHRDYFLSLLWYLQNDPELPESFRADAQSWGLSKDEFTDNGNFPFQLYIREARRMVGSYVLRQSDLTTNREKADGICLGNYGVDCHIVQRITVDGKERVDRTRHIEVDPYNIPYGSLTPEEVSNLLVPVCCSATHVAYCSLRMEPVYMMLGHAAGNAAHLALAARTSVQGVDVQKLRALLLKEGAVLTPPPATTSAAKAAKEKEETDTTSEEELKMEAKTASVRKSDPAPEDEEGPTNPALKPIKDEPGLPRVLLIGDSVSIGYTLPVRELLKGKANVHRIPGNGGSTGVGLKKMTTWLGEGKWDVIHFNFGLHDAKLPPEGVRHSEPSVYEKNLRTLVAQLKATGAKLVWATITPVPNGGDLSPTRKFADVGIYNAVAKKVMEENGIAIDDLNAAVLPDLAKLQKPGDVHFAKDGSALLAARVSASIEPLLPSKSAPPAPAKSAPKKSK